MLPNSCMPSTASSRSKDLGFTLEQVSHLLGDDLEDAELRGMLRLRRAQLADEARAVGTRLAAVESRLRMIEKENQPMPDYVIKTVPALCLVARRATIDPAEISAFVGPTFDAVAHEIGHVSGALATPIATYNETEEGMHVVVGYATHVEAPAGTEPVDLPEQTAACGVHLRSMATIGESWQALHRWIVENGHTFDGPCRELYVRAESDDQADWVTELQQPIRPA